MSEVDFQAVNLAIKQIDADPRAYLDWWLVDEPAGWAALLRLYAEQLLKSRGAPVDERLAEWAFRYGLNPAVGVTRFMFELCHTTLFDVSQQLTEHSGRLYEQAKDIAWLMGQFEALLKHQKTQNIVDIRKIPASGATIGAKEEESL